MVPVRDSTSASSWPGALASADSSASPEVPLPDSRAMASSTTTPSRPPDVNGANSGAGTSAGRHCSSGIHAALRRSSACSDAGDWPLGRTADSAESTASAVPPADAADAVPPVLLTRTWAVSRSSMAERGCRTAPPSASCVANATPPGVRLPPSRSSSARSAVAAGTESPRQAAAAADTTAQLTAAWDEAATSADRPSPPPSAPSVSPPSMTPTVPDAAAALANARSNTVGARAGSAAPVAPPLRPRWYVLIPCSGSTAGDSSGANAWRKSGWCHARDTIQRTRRAGVAWP